MLSIYPILPTSINWKASARPALVATLLVSDGECGAMADDVGARLDADGLLRAARAA
jgi:hypothetical protein